MPTIALQPLMPGQLEQAAEAAQIAQWAWHLTDRGGRPATSQCLPTELACARAANTLTATYNDLDSVRKLLEEHKDEVAGVILEPVVGNSGFIAPDRAFLQGLRELTQEHGTLLIFDEVMTGFRCA